MTTASTPAAQLDAALRADEKQALAFAEWATGSPEAGLELTARWLHHWHTVGGLNAGATLPSRGMRWRTLVTRLPAQAPSLLPDDHALADLAQLPMRPRIAVLLSLLGLTPAEAAEAMRLSAHAHGVALTAGLPHTAAGSVDSARWQAWTRALATHVEHLGLDRIESLVQARAGLAVLPLDTRAAAWDSEGQKQRTRRRVLLVGVVCATLLALTFVPGVRERVIGDGEVNVETRTLAAAKIGTAATPRPANTPMAVDPVARDLAFYAWYANREKSNRPAVVLEPLVAPASTPANATPESDDAP